CLAFAHSRFTRSSVSSPASVVKSMHEIARSSHATWQSFFTVRRVVCVAARRSTALVFTRTDSTHSPCNGIPRFGRGLSSATLLTSRPLSDFAVNGVRAPYRSEVGWRPFSACPKFKLIAAFAQFPRESIRLRVAFAAPWRRRHQFHVQVV